MNFVYRNWRGFLLCLAIAIPSWLLGSCFPIVGGAVIAIIAGMIVALFLKNRTPFAEGIQFVSKKILQWAVVLLGFGMNLTVIVETGRQSLPIILCTISISLLIAYLLYKAMKLPAKTATLIGVGSSICGGSAIAATAPVIDASDEEVAQSISVIFLFNVIAAVLFPILGNVLGFDTTSGEAFGIFAGTAVNDTSSVTAAASTWDSMESRDCNTRQSGNGQADPYTRHHSDNACTGIPTHEKGERKKRNVRPSQTDIPLFYSVFRARISDHHHRHQPRCLPGSVSAGERPQQIFDCHGNGRHRAEHRYYPPGQNRRKTDSARRLLLAWHYRSQPAI